MVGWVIYGLADLFAGYDGQCLAVQSRPLTTFGCMIGLHCLTSLLQGMTNSMPEFQQCVTHILAEEVPEYGNGFVDDVTVYGPSSRYNDEEITPEIRRFVYEYANTLTRFLVRFKAAGIMASGS